MQQLKNYLIANFSQYRSKKRKQITQSKSIWSCVRVKRVEKRNVTTLAKKEKKNSVALSYFILYIYCRHTKKEEEGVIKSAHTPKKL